MLVVGAGPSGLSAAYHLARLGHEVEIRDTSPEPGGMMRYGIPEYRLPRDVIDGEVARLLAMGVRIVTDHTVKDLLAEQKEGGFDAVFVARCGLFTCGRDRAAGSIRHKADAGSRA